ncbi:MAG: membrane protein [marine bacterium B5-7]|nr:MAG: membrane protein [marine bacterium B5-7]
MTDTNRSEAQLQGANFPGSLGPDLKKIFGDLGKNWGWILALGMVFIVLGIIALGMPVMMTLTTVMFIGVLLAIGGAAQIFNAFKCAGWKGRVAHILIGLLYIVAAGVIVNNPALSSLAFTAMLAGLVVAVGVLRIIMAFQMKGQPGWVWLIIAGLISIGLGAVIYAEWPVSGLSVIGILVAFELITNGFFYLFVGLAARKMRHAINS